MRLLDVIFVAKNEDGTIEPVVVGGDDDDLGALLSSILPFGGGGVVEPTGDAGSSGSAMADAWALAESLLPGTALALLLVEHGWARALFEAVSESGGALLGEGFLTAEAGLVVGAEVAALEEAAQVIAVARPPKPARRWPLWRQRRRQPTRSRLQRRSSPVRPLSRFER